MARNFPPFSAGALVCQRVTVAIGQLVKHNTSQTGTLAHARQLLSVLDLALGFCPSLHNGRFSNAV